MILNFDRNSKARRNVTKEVSCYLQLFAKRSRKRQATLMTSSLKTYDKNIK